MPKDVRDGPRHASEGTTLRISCHVCERETVHNVIRAAEYQSTYTDGEFQMRSWDTYQIVECRGCESLGFRSEHSNTEDYDTDPRTGEDELMVKEELYPNRAAGRAAIDDSWILPPQIVRIYTETLACMQSGHAVLAGVGLRAVIETVCKERGAQGRSLEKQIDDLVAQGVLTREGATVLHDLRILGNEAAHEVKPHTLETLNIAMDVVEHLLNGVYIIPSRASNLPTRPTT